MRSTTFIPTADHERAGAIISEMMQDSGYSLTEYNGEQVWKRGKGILLNPQIFRMYPDHDRLVVEAWMPIAILPGVYVGESGLDSWWGFAVKEAMKATLRTIIQIAAIPDAPIAGYMP